MVKRAKQTGRTTKERIKAVKLFYKYGSAKKVLENWKRSKKPYRRFITYTVKKFEKTGSVLDKEITGRKNLQQNWKIFNVSRTSLMRNLHRQQEMLRERQVYRYCEDRNYDRLILQRERLLVKLSLTKPSRLKNFKSRFIGLMSAVLNIPVMLTPLTAITILKVIHNIQQIFLIRQDHQWSGACFHQNGQLDHSLS
ncbi:MAG: hypothetical protein EZS28_024856 [Streblomastix strix]|uniref:DUF4817 domain-containing protein n=1 Tax=Streblomastix strix TaxID=222440 RepID=A0A5J4VAV1_9EUKA|nr:MAG: hypothetical protein EZS28_024856 [Streblomastix strix]